MRRNPGWSRYHRPREGTRTAAAAYDNQALQGKLDIIYNFGNDMIDDQAISITRDEVKVPGFDQPLVFRKDERYSDMKLREGRLEEMRRLLKHLKKAHDSAALSEQRYNEAEQAIIGR